MGLFRTEWQIGVEDKSLVIVRNEWTKGFRVCFDGQVVGQKRWSLIGTGTVEGSFEHAGKSRSVRVQISARRIEVYVDGQSLPVTQVA